MERNKKRNIKFAVATTLAFIFMIAMSVTSLAAINVRVEASPYGTDTGGADLSVDLIVDLTAAPDGFASLPFAVQWNTGDLAIVPRTGVAAVWNGEFTPGSIEIAGNSPADIAAGDILVTLAAEDYWPPRNHTASGVGGRLRFNATDAADGDVTIELQNYGNTLVFVGYDPQRTDSPNVTGFTFNATRIRWGYYNADTPVQAFITAVTTNADAAAWLSHFLDVLAVVPQNDGEDLAAWHARAHAGAVYWEARRAAAAVTE